jgi:phospholipase C
MGARHGKTKPRARIAKALSAPPAGPIRHVVLLTMENRSFDHMLGALQKAMPDIDGVVTPNGVPRSNADKDGTYPQAAGASRRVKPDPMHETKNVLRQLENGNAGFVSDYSGAHADTSAAQRQEVMAYHDVGTLSALHTLARQFTVCDRWFSSVPGPTWTNRLFALSGTSLGRVRMPTGIFDLNLHRYQQDTIFDRLTAAKRTWRIYVGDFPLSLLFEHQRTPSAAPHYFDIDAFAKHAKGDPDDFPEFAFIEPRYVWPWTDDDHPPHDTNDGERLIAGVYEAIRGNRALWESTLLVITYDEHGGFYDHVSPGAATPPDDHHEEYTFDSYGVRVPALLVSPWVEQTVVHQTFDHTSVLRYLIDLWSLGPLGRRTAAAQSIEVAIRTTGAPRTDTPATLAATRATKALARAAAAPKPPEHLNDLQKSIVAFSQLLEKETRDDATKRVARSMKLLQGPPAQANVAVERARRFLRQRGGRV